jgi:hypothetical protein
MRVMGGRLDLLGGTPIRRAATALLMLRCDPGLDPGEPRSTHAPAARRCIDGAASFEAAASRRHLRMRVMGGRLDLLGGTAIRRAATALLMLGCEGEA